MEQLKSYLSRQRHIGNALMIGDEPADAAFARYLRRELGAAGVTEVIMTAKGDGAALRDLIVERQIDTVLFGEGQAEKLKGIEDIRIRYLVGRIRMREDYFGLWERYRERAEHIYMAREREDRAGRDVDRYEVLEWSRGESPIELSVVVPVYNVRQYLDRCIQSLLSWRAPYVEYLLVDDGSTDGCSELIDLYAARDPRVRHIWKANGGCASARNLGLREAVGRYVGFVDADDFVDGRMFYKLLRRAMMGNYELSYCGYREYHEAGGGSWKVLNDCMGEPYVTGTYRWDYVQKLAVNTRVAIWRCLYSRELLQREGITFHEELKRFDDLPFKIECCFLAHSAVCVPEHLYCYRLGREGQDVSCSDERLFVHFDIFRILDEEFMPMKDRRMMDYLQVVKLHTHGYALRKIDRKYYKKYRAMAGKQLDETAGTARTLVLMLVYGGRGNFWWYLKSRARIP